MNFRKFLLENEKGQQFRLDDLNDGCFLTSPSNLGFSYKIDYEQLGYSFISVFKQIEQKNPTGTVYFKSYDKVREFIDFIESSELLKYLYIVPYEKEEKRYYKDVELVKFDKTEKVGKWLACPIELASKSLWYEENTVIYNISEQEDEIFWDFKWDSKFSDYNTRNLQFINKGHVEAPIIVEIDGEAINPKLELYIEGELYQEIPLNVTINKYEKLLYCTKEMDFYIKRQKADGSTESLFNLDVLTKFQTNDYVMRLPKNKSCEIRLKAENEILKAQITIFTYYKAV